jgi:hypothetical protein
MANIGFFKRMLVNEIVYLLANGKYSYAEARVK